MIPYLSPFLLSESQCWALVAAVTMMALDMLSGFLAAVHNREVESKKMREGLFHKASLLLVVTLAYLLEVYSTHVEGMGFQIPLFVPACALIVLMEVVSIIENIVKLNPGLADTQLIGLFVKKGDDEGAQGDGR